MPFLPIHAGLSRDEERNLTFWHYENPLQQDFEAFDLEWGRNTVKISGTIAGEETKVLTVHQVNMPESLTGKMTEILAMIEEGFKALKAFGPQDPRVEFSLSVLEAAELDRGRVKA